ncbi:hypothetical protein PG984_015155 [Apiospora sp. TS-2023a]
MSRLVYVGVLSASSSPRFGGEMRALREQQGNPRILDLTYGDDEGAYGAAGTRIRRLSAPGHLLLPFAALPKASCPFQGNRPLAGPDTLTPNLTNQGLYRAQLGASGTPTLTKPAGTPPSPPAFRRSTWAASKLTSYPVPLYNNRTARPARSHTCYPAGGYPVPIHNPTAKGPTTATGLTCTGRRACPELRRGRSGPLGRPRLRRMHGGTPAGTHPTPNIRTPATRVGSKPPPEGSVSQT